MPIRHMLTLLVAFLLGSSSALSEDWSSLFRDLTSTDPQTSEKARTRSFNELIPFLLHGDLRLVVPEVGKIAQLLDAPPNVRVQVSALLYIVANGRRSDSAAALSAVLPKVREHLRDDDDLIRFNAARTLSELQPVIPVEVIPDIVASLKSGDVHLVRAASLGAARVANVSSDAAEALSAILRSDMGKAAKQAVMYSIVAARVTAPQVQNGLAKLLETTREADLLLSGLEAASAIGSEATDRLVRSVDLVGAGTLDPEVTAAATKARKRLQEGRK